MEPNGLTQPILRTELIQSNTSMVKFVLITLVFGAILWSLSYLSQTAEIHNNWNKHRCEPGVIPFASFFGHDTVENFNYCMTYMFRGQAGQFLSPILNILATIVTIFSTLIRSLSSIRLMISNIVNSATSVLSDMRHRIMSIMLELRNTLLRMKQLMYRLYATFYAIIYMGMSGMNAAVTFGNSTVGRFLDTFCFHPDTHVILKDGSSLSMKNINIGDEIIGSSGELVRITSKLIFDSNQQKHNMFSLHDIIVSGGHYVQYNNEWIQVKFHPNAQSVNWNSTIPIICFNTSTGYIPIAGTDIWTIFADYDEDRTADKVVMAKHEAILGPRNHNSLYIPKGDYALGIGLQSSIRMVNGIKSVATIQIGDETYYGRILAIVDEECDTCVQLCCGDLVSEAILLWDSVVNGYVRAGTWALDGRAKYVKGSHILRNFIVDGAEVLELNTGIFVKDYVEISTSDTQTIYDNAMKK